VIAVGHPYGYRNTVSSGIVSALRGEITMPNGTVLGNLIQTSASINPGNSGGPLLNINGELIGLNVALRDGAQGIAFALNADTVQEALSRHLSSLRMAGVRSVFTCHETLLRDPGSRQHVVIDSVAVPADKLLQPGDVVLQLAGRSVVNRRIGLGSCRGVILPAAECRASN